ncbi:MAG TPA: P63C domain-containing protein [Gemmataceae bacterium]|nr:P63C domain-containing protein [Gemmataceae bacterium]
MIAPHNGMIRIGELEIPCGVLEDGTRVLSERGVLKALGIGRSGYAHNRAKEDAEGGGAGLPLFVAPINLKPFIDLELASVLQKPIWYRPITSDRGVGILHKGVRADLLPKICNVWLKARDADVIKGARQTIVVANADILLRGLAEVGITALVDEATGYQESRARDALAKILEAFVAKELRKWIKTFPVDFYAELFRLRGLEYGADKPIKAPRYIGHLTNDIVYSRLAPGILAELKERNPVAESGYRKSKHHQWLTADIGHPKLLQHLSAVVALMKVSADGDYDGFKKLLNRALPKQIDCPLFDNIPDNGGDSETELETN